MAKKGYRKRVLSFLLAGLLVGTTVGSDLGVTVMASSTGTETPGTPKTTETAFIENTGYPSLEAALNAVSEGATAQIDLKADQTINKTLVLKKGQKISIVPKDVPKVTISRADKFAGDMFDVTAENAVLTLGKQGMTGTLVLDGTAKGLDAGTPVGAVVKKTGDGNLVKNDKVEIVNKILGTVAVTGTPAVGQTLTADVSKVNPSNAIQGLGYQWQRCEDGKQPVDIAGATASTYTITNADVGNTLQVTVSGTAGFTGNIKSDKTAKVIKNSIPAPKVSGEAEYGDKLEKFSLSGDKGTYAWKDPSTVLSDVGDITYEATFTPNDPGAYEAGDVSVTVPVKPRKVTIDIKKDLKMTYGDTFSLNNPYDVTAGTIIDGDDLGLTYKSKAQDPGAAVGKYPDVTGEASNPKYNVTVNSGEIEIVKAKTKLSIEAKAVDKGGLAIELTVTAAPNGTGNTPTGAIKFSQGTELRDENPVALENGIATYIYKVDEVGKKLSFKAEYQPDADSNYSSAEEDAVIEVTPNKLEQVLSIEEVKNKVFGDEPFELNVSGAKGNGKLTFSVEAGKDVISVDEKGKVTIKAAGEATVKVTKEEDANYKSASASLDITVDPMKLTADDVKITGISSSYPSTGKQIKPTPTVKLGDKKLKKDTDYDLKYGKNTAVGTGTVEIIFKGNYTGTIKKTFKITKKSTTPAKKSSNTKKSATSKAKGAKTADNTPISSAMLALLLSGTVGGAIIYKRRRTTK
ncbi:hypothetical protein [Lactonifactor longoviformis]|uniref:Uncharacterized protein n=1 Tax=Lactonifactor longoviformis DSM 17459 TaxID=1122155 RepID=A0A1M4YDC6_9CLOT|nr:hypothetical protein [Lactonifactor longoviformis]SHF03628.1 hypothetical protein SAMN02745158_02318 [Lactonifactor longoviformis DSM 17459]